MPKPPDPLATIMRRLHEEVAQELALTKEIGHPGESGRAREEIIRRFLRRFVPSALGVDTGFVLDIHGNISRQVDVIIHRHDYHPVLEIGGLKHFMVESVVAAVEVKAAATSKRVLEDALDAVRSVKQLDRTGGHRNYVVADFHVGGPRVSEEGKRQRIWTAVIAEQCLARDSVVEVLEDDCQAYGRDVWVDCLTAVHDFTTHFMSSEGQSVAYADDAAAVVLSDPAGDGGEPPLTDFAFRLARRLRHAAIVDYDPGAYFPWSRSWDRSVQLGPGDLE